MTGASNSREVQILVNSLNNEILGVFEFTSDADSAKARIISDLRVALSRAGMSEADIKFPTFKTLSKFIANGKKE